MGAGSIFHDLLGHLFEQCLPLCVSFLQLPHFEQILIDLIIRKQDPAALFADHFQNDDEVLEITDVVDGQINM